MDFDLSDVDPPPAPTRRRRADTIPLDIEDVVELVPARVRTAVGTTPPPRPPTEDAVPDPITDDPSATR